VYAIKGMGGAGKPVWPKRASKNNKGRVNLFMVGVDAAKDAVYARLKIKDAGPGYCHFPKGREPAYFEQLTAEVVQTKWTKGFPHRVYVLPGGRRNEALDLRVYAYAALQALNVRWGYVQAAQQAPPPTRDRPPPSEAAPVEQAPAQPAGVSRSRPQRKGGFLGNRGGWLR
jgi:phage terminase large subunit GpA-like protein